MEFLYLDVYSLHILDRVLSSLGLPGCFACDAVVRRTLVLIAFHRSHCFHVEFP